MSAQALDPRLSWQKRGQDTKLASLLPSISWQESCNLTGWQEKRDLWGGLGVGLDSQLNKEWTQEGIRSAWSVSDQRPLSVQSPLTRVHKHHRDAADSRWRARMSPHQSSIYTLTTLLYAKLILH